MTNLRKRLKKLESQVPPQPSRSEKAFEVMGWFLRISVAHYLGDPTPEESIAEAYARALGYPSSSEFRKALDADDSDLAERVDLAKRRLLAKFGVRWEEDEWDAIVDAFKRMEAGLSERYYQFWREISDQASACLGDTDESA